MWYCECPLVFQARGQAAVAVKWLVPGLSHVSNPAYLGKQQGPTLAAGAAYIRKHQEHSTKQGANSTRRTHDGSQERTETKAHTLCWLGV